MKWQFEAIEDEALFKDIIRTRLQARTIRQLDNNGYRPAAVLMLLMNKDMHPSVLLTVRTNNVSTHKGEVSFPGGGYDDVDKNMLDTALRETEEEVGIQSTNIEILGQYDHYISIFGFHVSCYVGWIKYPFEYTINQDEISKIIIAPLRLFAEKKYDHYDIYEYQGTPYKIYHYFYDNDEIWGLTARILTDFGSDICI